MKISNNHLNSNMDLLQNKIKDQNQTSSFDEILEKAKESGNNEELKEACNEFEAVFINTLLKNMRRTIPENDFIKKSHARKVFEGMMDEKIADEMASGQGIGLSKMLYNELKNNQK